MHFPSFLKQLYGVKICFLCVWSNSKPSDIVPVLSTVDRGVIMQKRAACKSKISNQSVGDCIWLSLQNQCTRRNVVFSPLSPSLCSRLFLLLHLALHLAVRWTFFSYLMHIMWRLTHIIWHFYGALHFKQSTMHYHESIVAAFAPLWRLKNVMKCIELIVNPPLVTVATLHHWNAFGIF